MRAAASTQPLSGAQAAAKDSRRASSWRGVRELSRVGSRPRRLTIASCSQLGSGIWPEILQGEITMRRTFVLVSLWLGLAGAAGADGLFYRLPADGEFAGYIIEVSFTSKGLEMTGRGNATMSSVGQETIKGKKC